MAYRFVLNETSCHGAGAIDAIPEEAKGRGFQKAFVCSDPDLVKFGVTKRGQDCRMSCIRRSSRIRRLRTCRPA